jgi:hypothetical protein
MPFAAYVATSFESGPPCLNLMGRFYINALALFLMATIFSGCHRHQPAAQFSKPYQAAPEPSNELVEIAVSERSPIQMAYQDQISGGTPVNPDAQNSLRRLSIVQCSMLARRSSRAGNALDGEYERLRCKEHVPECILQMLQLSADHQRNESAGQALEAYLNLVEVYLQHDVLLESAVLVQETHETLDQIRAAGVVVDFDRRELDRRRMEAEEKAFELLEKQQQLTSGLEILLQLRRTAKSPIWTEFQAESIGVGAAPDLNSSLTIAWENRKDLQAMKVLATCCSEDLLDAIRASARSLHPLLGLALSPRPLFFRALFGPEENLQETNSLQRHITGVIESQKDLIEAEVSNRVFSIEKRIAVMQLKQAQIDSLRNSIQSAKDAASIKPVDLETQLNQKSEILRIRSEIIHERIALEIDRMKLMQAQGLLNN